MNKFGKTILASAAALAAIVTVKVGVTIRSKAAKNKLAQALGERLAYMVNNMNHAAKPKRQTKLGYGVQPIIHTREKEIILLVGENIMVQGNENQYVVTGPEVKWNDIKFMYNEFKIQITWQDKDNLDDIIAVFVDAVPTMVMG